MTKRLATMCLVAMFLIGLAAPSVRAQDTFAATLKGISAVFVLVESLPDGAKVLNLTKDTIQTDVELKLRLAGMRVASQQEGEKLSGSPHLYVQINLTDSAQAASIDVELDQNATLELNGQFAPAVATWSKGILIASPTAQGIRDGVKDRIDQFLNAWLSVNPKK